MSVGRVVLIFLAVTVVFTALAVVPWRCATTGPTHSPGGTSPGQTTP